MVLKKTFNVGVRNTGWDRDRKSTVPVKSEPEAAESPIAVYRDLNPDRLGFEKNRLR